MIEGKKHFKYADVDAALKKINYLSHLAVIFMAFRANDCDHFFHTVRIFLGRRHNISTC